MTYCPLYQNDPERPYGPRWKDRRPPGLPKWARATSRHGEAIPFVRRCAIEVEGSELADALERLTLNESGGRFALPANIFDARPRHRRPPWKRLITAWGAFQYNRAAWQRFEPGEPWEATTRDEVWLPIVHEYAPRWREAVAAGATPAQAERVIRLWHMAPVLVERTIDRIVTHGWAFAWGRVPSKYRRRIESKLRS